MANSIELDGIVHWIDGAFGPAPSLADPVTAEQDRSELRRILGEDGYRHYLRDEINRHIIRDYLTNAVVLGVIDQEGLDAFTPALATEEGRAALSLYMLMSSVEEAAELAPPRGESQSLKPLRPAPGDRSHIKLVHPE